MNFKKVAVLFALSLLAFSFYFIRPDFAGADSYYFLQNVCNNAPLDAEIFTVQFFFSLLECNIVALKLLLFCCLFISSVVVGQMGEIFDKKDGWLVGVFAFLSPAWISQFYYFENDQFAYPLLFLSLFLFLKGYKEENTQLKLLSLVTLAIAGTLWGGAIVYLIGFSLLFAWALLLVLPVLATFPDQFVKTVVPDFRVIESLPFFGLVSMFFLLVGLLTPITEIMPLLMWFMIIAGANAKFAIHAVPLLSLFFLKFLKEKLPQYIIVFIFLAFGMAFIFSFMSPDITPTKQTWEAIDYGIQLSEDMNVPLANEWSLGYWVEWRGVTASAKSGAQIQNYSEKIVIDIWNYNGKNCELKKQFGNLGVFDCRKVKTND